MAEPTLIEVADEMVDYLHELLLGGELDMLLEDEDDLEIYNNLIAKAEAAIKKAKGE